MLPFLESQENHVPHMGCVRATSVHHFPYHLLSSSISQYTSTDPIQLGFTLYFQLFKLGIESRSLLQSVFGTIPKSVSHDHVTISVALKYDVKLPVAARISRAFIPSS
jgi:hypothetical protein